MNCELQKTREVVLQHQSFLITTHIHPDGDGIGSELALARLLQGMGKTVEVVNSTPTPRKYRFLDPANVIRLFDSTGPLPDAEVVFILDISRWERLGNMAQLIRNHPGIKICIDHHPVNGNFADVNLICEDACASGEIVLRFINFMGSELTAQIAEPLYASILTDTGAFRFPNTSSQTHAAAAQLLSTGIRSELIYDQIYERCSPARVKLLGCALTHLEYLHAGRLAWMAITQSMMEQTGVEVEEIEGFVDIARGIHSVEASLLFIELPQEKVKVSLRSRGNVDVNCFASRFGGGGHRHASGFLMEGALQTVIEWVLRESPALFPLA
ncbi:bifunctional oligoribonuclease/PAP phosphatase NrnA [bacterium]|nr:bifunctional oligoribonuclease/PAP phosphatase NrnA [bacterium]